jgi:hypothetical protein
MGAPRAYADTRAACLSASSSSPPVPTEGRWRVAAPLVPYRLPADVGVIDDGGEMEALPVEPYAEALRPIPPRVHDRSFQGSDPETRRSERTGEYRDGICNPVLDASRLPELEQRGMDRLFRCDDDDSSSLALGSDHVQALTGTIADGSIGRAGESSTLIVQVPTCGSRAATEPVA